MPFITWCWGFILGVFLMILILEEEYTVGYEAVNLIEECQETLPRNVECGIVAVPENEIKEEK